MVNNFDLRKFPSPVYGMLSSFVAKDKNINHIWLLQGLNKTAHAVCLSDLDINSQFKSEVRVNTHFNGFCVFLCV